MGSKETGCQDHRLIEIVEQESPYFDRLVEEGLDTPVNHGASARKNTNFDWVDPVLVKEGQQFFRNNVIQCALAGFYGQLFAISLPRATAANLHTYLSKQDQAFTRIAGTFYHIWLWVNSDLMDKVSKASQSVYSVAKMHESADKKYDSRNPLPELKHLTDSNSEFLKALKIDLNNYDDSICPKNEQLLTLQPKRFMTQLDMAMLQFCYYGPLVYFPKYFGGVDPKGLKAYIHLWAVFGKLLGIEDAYNAALHFQDEVSQQNMFQKIVFIGLKNMTDYGINIISGIFQSSLKFLIVFRLNPYFYYYVKNTIMSNADALYSIMSMYDKVIYFIYSCIISSLNVWIFRIVANFLVGRILLPCFFVIHKNRKGMSPHA